MKYQEQNEDDQLGKGHRYRFNSCAGFRLENKCVKSLDENDQK